MLVTGLGQCNSGRRTTPPDWFLGATVDLCYGKESLLRTEREERSELFSLIKKESEYERPTGLPSDRITPLKSL